MDSIDTVMHCLYFSTPDEKIVPVVVPDPATLTPYQKMVAKIEAMTDEDVKGVWDAIQFSIPRGMFDRSASWDHTPGGMTLEDWEYAIYSAMDARGLDKFTPASKMIIS